MKVVVLIDKREKRPLTFPATIKWHAERGGRSTLVIVKTKQKTLPEGDYCLEGHDKDCIIERKGGLNELSQNLLSNDYERASKAFSRLEVSTRHPYLLIEASCSQLRKPTRWTQNPEAVSDALAGLIRRRNLGLLLVGRCSTPKAKRVVGEFVLRLMLAHSFGKETDYASADKVIDGLARPNRKRPKRSKKRRKK